MGKLCLESWVPPSRQGCQADVGRGTEPGPGGRGHRAWQTRGRHCPGPGAARTAPLLSAINDGLDTDTTDVLQGPRATTGFCGMGVTPGREFRLCLDPLHLEHCWFGSTGWAGGEGCPRFGGLRHCWIPAHGDLLCVGMRHCVPWIQTKGHYFFMRRKPPKMPQQTEQVAAVSSNSRLQTSSAPKVLDESH